MKKPVVLYVMYSHKRHYIDADNWYNETILHGIFTEKEVSKYADKRKSVNASCMIIPLNKFVDSGVDL